MAFGKPKAPKEPKPPKAPKEKKPKKPKKEKPPKVKKGKKGQEAPEEVEGLEGMEGEEQPKKKKPLILLLIPVVVIAAAAAIIILVVLPKLNGEADVDPEASASQELLPPELPSQIPIGDDVNIAGMQLEADESGAQVTKSKRVAYTYTNLVDAGKAAETYAGQLAKESFSVVDEEFVRQNDKPDYTTAEGEVLLARNVTVKEAAATPAPETKAPEATESLDPEASVEPTPTPDPTPEPEPTPEPVTYVHTVRITWSPGKCVVVADEEEGKVTAPKSATTAQHSVSQRGAVKQLEMMDPAALGLPGESMDEYEVLSMDGAEMVDGVPAIRLHVYSDNNAAESNDFMECYLMTIDAEHLYHLDLDTNEITELEFEYQP